MSLNQGTANYTKIPSSVFIRGNTRISCKDFAEDKRARDCKCFLIFVFPAYNNVRKKYIPLSSFYAVRILTTKFERSVLMPGSRALSKIDYEMPCSQKYSPNSDWNPQSDIWKLFDVSLEISSDPKNYFGFTFDEFTKLDFRAFSLFDRQSYTDTGSVM